MENSADFAIGVTLALLLGFFIGLLGYGVLLRRLALLLRERHPRVFSEMFGTGYTLATTSAWKQLNRARFIFFGLWQEMDDPDVERLGVQLRRIAVAEVGIGMMLFGFGLSA